MRVTVDASWQQGRAAPFYYTEQLCYYIIRISPLDALSGRK